MRQPDTGFSRAMNMPNTDRDYLYQIELLSPNDASQTASARA